VSQKHLEQIHLELTNKGWSVVNKYSDNLYHIVTSETTIYWEISRGCPSNSCVIEFWLNTDLGERSTDLKDINWCTNSQNGKELFFSKVKSKQWREDMKIFINEL